MTRCNWLLMVGVLFLATGTTRLATAANAKKSDSETSKVPAKSVEFFKAMDDGELEVKFIAKNDHAARVLITNTTNQPLDIDMPEAFAGVPVLAQIGGGGFGGGGRGGGGGGLGGGGGGQQSVGGGGLGGGGGGLGGGGGQFSIPPEQTAKINVAVVCLDHGLRDPSSSRPYKIVPADEHLDKPEVIELLKAFGRGGLDHQSVQAAAWHLNNDLSWDQLAAKLQGTRRSPSRPPYFSRQQIQAGIAYATEASRLAVINAESYKEEKAKRLAAKKSSELESSEARSTTDADATEATDDDVNDADAAGTEAEDVETAEADAA